MSKLAPMALETVCACISKHCLQMAKGFFLVYCSINSLRFRWLYFLGSRLESANF